MNSLRNQTPYSVRRYQSSRNQLNRRPIIRRNLLNSESTSNLRVRNPFTDRGLTTGINERHLRDASDVFIRYFPDFYANGQYIGPTISASVNTEELSDEFLRPIPVHPTSEQISDAIRIVEYGSINDPSNAICPITLQPFLVNETVSEILYCRHIFNTESLNEWFQENVRCPLCRYDIREYNPRTRDTLRIEEITEEAIEEDSQEDSYEETYENETYENNNTSEDETIMEEEIVNNNENSHENSDNDSEDTIVNNIFNEPNLLDTNNSEISDNSTSNVISTIFNNIPRETSEFTTPLFNNLSFITNIDNNIENIESLIRTDNSLNNFLNNINTQISNYNRNNFNDYSYSYFNNDLSNNYSPV